MFKKFFKFSFIVLPAAIFLTAYSSIPENVSVTLGQNPEFKWGMSVEAVSENCESYSCRVKLFNFIPIKTVNVSVNPKMYLIPSGKAIGVRLYTDGILVVGTGEVYDDSGRKYHPAKDAGILTGDRIISANGKKLSKTEDIAKSINENNGTISLEVIRGDKQLDITLNAVFSPNSGCYKAGLWVRDSTAGIGTMTFINPDNSTFAALGHAICDSDTKDILPVSHGNISNCTINRVYKGENGSPGELSGKFSNDIIGKITKNTGTGLYGNYSEEIQNGEKIPAASRFQVKEGKAEILCDIDGNGPKPYKIEITKLSKSVHALNKDMVIKITDPVLLEKTGGIIQGMSGSPIIQNGRIVGAVTHVFVNDPTRGYGIFIENMLAEAEKIK